LWKGMKCAEHEPVIRTKTANRGGGCCAECTKENSGWG
jgi:hypothetical protein